ncbi:MAG: hypothetical protein HY856_13975 [Burkholderiales bacterium]|nr:hypothetical protein [Burkholderiales bacterium]
MNLLFLIGLFLPAGAAFSDFSCLLGGEAYAKPTAFFRRQPSADLFVQEHPEAKLAGFIANLAAMDDLIDFSAIAVQVDTARALQGIGIVSEREAVERLGAGGKT